MSKTEKKESVIKELTERVKKGGRLSQILTDEEMLKLDWQIE